MLDQPGRHHYLEAELATAKRVTTFEATRLAAVLMSQTVAFIAFVGNALGERIGPIYRLSTCHQIWLSLQGLHPRLCLTNLDYPR